MTLKPETREKLLHVSAATLTTALFKRGYRNTFLQNVHPVSPKDVNMVGPAYTLRYIPAREDLNQITVFDKPGHPQRVAVEEMPAGHVLVMDSRGDARAASAGDILVTRMWKRGAEGVVTDGGFRDSPSIAELGIRTYHQRPSSPTNLIMHQAIELQTPIGCGGVPVFPGDIVVGDNEGVVIVPQEIVDEIAEEAARMTLFETFVSEQVHAGKSITGLYPPTEEASRTAFEEWKKNRSKG